MWRYDGRKLLTAKCVDDPARTKTRQHASQNACSCKAPTPRCWLQCTVMIELSVRQCRKIAGRPSDPRLPHTESLALMLIDGSAVSPAAMSIHPSSTSFALLFSSCPAKVRRRTRLGRSNCRVCAVQQRCMAWIMIFIVVIKFMVCRAAWLSQQGAYGIEKRFDSKMRTV